MINVTNLDLDELKIYKSYNETQLLHYYEPDPGIFIAESPKVIDRALNAGYEPISLLLEEGHVQNEAASIIERLESEYNVPVYLAKAEILVELTGYELTRGALCAMKRKPLVDAASLCQRASKVAVLENVVNPTNIGSIVRNAAALGIDAILFTRGCADPLYKRALRVSMGTALQIPWTFFDSTDSSYIDDLKGWGFTTIAMALKDDSKSINDPLLYENPKTAIVLGTEGEGLCDDTISRCNYTVCIPMKHGVDSLNVASASAIAFWSVVAH